MIDSAMVALALRTHHVMVWGLPVLALAVPKQRQPLWRLALVVSLAL